MKTFLVIALGVVFVCSFGQGKTGKKRYPLTLAGIKVGFTTDRQVVAKFGRGYFVGDEGHLGGRYFVAPPGGKARPALHVEIGVDHIIDEASLTDDSQTFHRKLNVKRALCSRLAHLPYVSGLSLGSTLGETRARWGKPARITGKAPNQTWHYAGGEEEVEGTLFFEADLRFTSGKLTRIRIYNGE